MQAGVKWAAVGYLRHLSGAERYGTAPTDAPAHVVAAQGQARYLRAPPMAPVSCASN